MHSDGRDPWSRAFRISGVALGVLVVAYGVYLLVIGIPWTVFTAVPPGEPLIEGYVTLRVDPVGVIPLLGGLAVVIGLITRWTWLAWAGSAVVAVFSATFVFGVGGVLVVPAAVLLLAVAAVTWSGARRRTSAEFRPAGESERR